MENRRLSASIARKILRMLEGETLPSSTLPSWIAQELLEEGLLSVLSRGSRKSYRLIDAEACMRYIGNRYTGGATLSRWIELAEGNEELDRGVLVRETGYSKAISLRTFRGFLVNCYEPLEATIGKNAFTLSPLEETALFIQSPETFHIEENVLVIGVENGDNFRQIRKQRYLFEKQKVLFVSRYPQSTDLREWLINIPNPYLHFGDFDLAGIHIYLTEFYRFLGNRASFFVPEDLEERLKKGNSTLYHKQYAYYKEMEIADPRLEPLVQMIHRYRRVYEQEGYLE